MPRRSESEAGVAGAEWVERAGEIEQNIQSVEDLALTVVVKSSL